MNPAEWIDRRPPELIEEHGVVGAQLAVLHNGEIADAAAGVLNNVSKEPVTTGSLFQIASITKVWTATLVQELVNEGLLDLDRLVRDVLPDFRLADERAAQAITPRQLLCHSAGFEGDLFFDTGTDDDALARFVARLTEADQITPPGLLWSYCNSGFSVLGRIVEVLRGKPFNTVLRERLADPFGLTVATTHGEGAELGVAAGHLAEDDVMKPVSDCGPESDWPAGSALAMSARDLLRFVRRHLETPAFEVMRAPQISLPDMGAWGLGWELIEYEGGSVIGHNGGNTGLASNLRIAPESGVAFALLTNGGNAQAVFEDVVENLFSKLAGVRRPDRPEPPAVAEPVDVERVAGTYRSAEYDVHVTPGDNGRVLVRFDERTGEMGTARECVALREDALIAVEKPHSVLVLIGRDERDRVRWLHFGRTAKRI